MIFLGINGIIGSGIFFLPGAAATLVGPASPLSIATAGLVATTVALSFAQCSAWFPHYGGAYIYAKEAFGEFIGFEVGILRWFISMNSWAALTVAFTQAVESLWPEAVLYHRMIITGIITLLATVNILGVNKTRIINDLCTLAKAVALLLLILASLQAISPSNLRPIWPQTGFANFSASVLLLFYMFTGFGALPIAAEDMKDPCKNLPIAILSAVGGCTLIYLLVQISVVGVLGSDAQSGNDPILTLLAVHLMGAPGYTFISFAMLLSVGGVTIVSSFLSPRALVALAQNRALPHYFEKKGRFGTPTLAILLTAVGARVFAEAGDFYHLAGVSVVSRMAQYFCTCGAVLLLFSRGFRNNILRGVWIYLIPPLGLGFSLWLLLSASPVQLSQGLVAFAVGVPLYLLQKKAQQSRWAFWVG